MLKAGSLLYAIFISLLITTLVGSFVLFVFYNQLHIELFNTKANKIKELDASINYLLADNRNEIWEEKLYFNKNSEESTDISFEFWGAYYLIRASNSFIEDKFYKAALAAYPNKDTSTAVYLADHGKPLSVAGKTNIVGNVYVSKRGIQRAYVEGKRFSGSRLVDGQIRESQMFLPIPNQDLFAYWTDLIKETIPAQIDSVIPFINLESLDSILLKRSFSKSTVCIYSQQNIQLLSAKIDGPYILKSEQEVFIGNKVDLKQTIVIAPKVTVEAGFNGSIQIFSSDSVIIEERAVLSYPSAVNMVGFSLNPYIELGPYAELDGEINLFSEVKGDGEGYISLAKDSKVVGKVYTNTKLEIKGTIIGSIIADRLYLKAKSAVYENHLLDATIDVKKLPNAYLSSVFINRSTAGNKKILKWLD